MAASLTGRDEFECHPALRQPRRRRVASDREDHVLTALAAVFSFAASAFVLRKSPLRAIVQLAVASTLRAGAGCWVSLPLTSGELRSFAAVGKHFEDH
jgi:hypothetical protein